MAQEPEANVTLPWAVDPVASWLDYRCWVETELDPGMALHKPLPQAAYTPDTLAAKRASSIVSIQNPNLDSIDPGQNGVNIAPNLQVTDVIQRMATSTYRFVLRGYGLRIGYQIPIPGLVSVGNVPTVPENPQRAYNVIVGNFGGVPLWFATWELHYIIAQTPSQSQAKVPVPFDPALHIRPDAKLPTDGILVPQTIPDQEHTANLGDIGGIPVIPKNLQ